MKTKILLLIAVLTLFISCGSEKLENPGLSDCAANFKNYLAQSEDDYQELMIQPDSEGNHQSLEACLNRRLYTQNYIVRLQDADIILDEIEGCTNEEYFEFRGLILERKQDLEEDMESTWNRCEEVYGG